MYIIQNLVLLFHLKSKLNHVPKIRTIKYSDKYT